MTLVSVIPTAFLPSVSYMAFVVKSSEVHIDISENYQKQTLRSRCSIMSSQATQMLTVPVRASSKKGPVSMALIDNSTSWQKIMLRSIQTAYGKAPFFEYYYDGYKALLVEKHDKLVDLNNAMLTLCLKNLKIKKNISYLSEFKHQYTDAIDLRNEEIALYCTHPSYQQVFGSIFVPDLSIIDLLFCEGPNATNVLNLSIMKQYT